jgi:thiol-disulfide isomerase/thioredoxin
VNDGKSGWERKLSRRKQLKKSKAPKSERPRGKGRLVFAAVLIIVVALVAYIVSQPPRQPGRIGDIGPDFTLLVVTANGLSDQTVTLSSYRGKVVVLEFMVSWCHVCQETAPSIEYLSQKYQGQDVVFLSVAGTQSGATAESTAAFIRQYGSTWTYVLDTDGSVFNAIIDRSGTILSRFQGAVATEAFSNAIDRALS